MESFVTLVEKNGISQFLRKYTKMAIRPSGNSFLLIEGKFDFSAQKEGIEPITDCYDIQISFPNKFPRELPTVYETAGRIPRKGEYHVNSDGSLCLGSPIRLLMKLSRSPTYLGFASECIVPYLFSISYKFKYGKFPFGELPHGTPGELVDYANLFGLKSIEQARVAVKYLGMKKRHANKLPCPCGCGRRLGKCSFNNRLNEFRLLAERGWFRSLL